MPRQHTDRIQFLLRAAREEGARLFDARRGICLIERDTIWYAIALLLNGNEEERDLGRSLLRDTPSVDGTHTPATLLAVSHGLGDELDRDSTDRLRERIGAELVHAAGVGWHDGNVNHPLGAWATLILGGEMHEQRWAVDLGVQSLARFRAVTGDRRHAGMRQAEMSEYNSPTYGALDLCFLALVAEYARDEQARRLAAFLERGAWLSTALRYHAPSGQFAGPHSRAYQDDSSGGFSGLHGVFAAAFDEPIFLDPGIARRFEHPSALLQNGLVAIVPFHPPAAARRLAFHPVFPRTIRCASYGEAYHENSAQHGFDPEPYPGGWSELTTHLEQDFTLGTSTVPYCNGAHSDSIMLRIARSRFTGSRFDFRSMFARGVFNESLFGQHNRCHTSGGSIDKSFYHEEGRTFIFQHRGSAIVQYLPKRAGHLGVRSFRVDIVFGYDVPFDRLRIGNTEVTALPASGAAGERVCFQDGGVFGLIAPLPAAPPPEGAGWTAELRSEHFVLSLWNKSFEAATDFTRDEIGSWRNGFHIELHDRAAFPDFDAFCVHAASLSITENILPDGTRSTHVSSPGGEMLLRVDTRAERILQRRWRGVDLRPVHFTIESPDEMTRLCLPFGPYAREAWEAGEPGGGEG